MGGPSPSGSDPFGALRPSPVRLGAVRRALWFLNSFRTLRPRRGSGRPGGYRRAALLPAVRAILGVLDERLVVAGLERALQVSEGGHLGLDVGRGRHGR